MSEVIDSKAATTRKAVIGSSPSNAAIQRLQQRVMSEVPASEVITSYDRMHHRHSRS